VLVTATVTFIAPIANEHGPDFIVRISVIDADGNRPHRMKFAGPTVTKLNSNQSGYDGVPSKCAIGFGKEDLIHIEVRL